MHGLKSCYTKEVLMAHKKCFNVLFLSFFLIAFCTEFAFAKTLKRAQAKAQTDTQAKDKGKRPQERTIERSPLALGLDSVFIKMKQELDDMVSSPLLHSKPVVPVNSYFLRTLKGNQPFYSLTRVNQIGDVVNEMIRLVEKAEEKKQNLSKEPWVKQTVKKKGEYSGTIKLEETGRYYLVWAASITGNNEKVKDPFEGALALKIDLWDSFHKFANTIETPFLIRIDRLHLYSNKWKDTIAYKEELLTVPGAKKVFVRYPKNVTTLVTAPAAPAPVISAPAAQAIDSSRIKAAHDSLKALIMKQDKKKAKTRIVIITVLILLIVIAGIILLVVIPAMKQRAIMKDIDHDGA
jgi:hypothetical protein